MPVTCKLVNNRWRIVEPKGKIATKGGKPVDGDGHDTREGCMRQARAMNAAMEMSGLALFPPKAIGAWKASESDQLTFEKELIYAGAFRQSDGNEFVVDEVTLDHWADTFKTMSANGVDVPVPKDHTTDPEARRGTVVAMAVGKNSDNIPALFARVKFRDAEAAQMAKTTQVSIYSPPEFVDGKGNRYVRPIRHVALTDYPVVPGLQGFETIAASFYDKENEMPLLDLTKKLDIECSEEEKAEGAIVAAFTEKGDNIVSLTKTVEERDKTIEALKKKIPSDPITVIASHRNMLKDNRTMKLDKLVGEKISPAVKDALLEIFCADEQLNLVLSTENGDDNFDKIVDALGKNEVVQLGGVQTGAQGATVLDKNQTAGDKNPLLADAQKRAKAVSQ